MSDQREIPNAQAVTLMREDPYKITSELLDDAGTGLTCFFFHIGANFYVFSYNSGGLRKHTFIDTGDQIYRNRILSVLTDHRIDPNHIERIIITHRHHDHCGLTDLLAGESGARILVHANFRDFVEGKLTEAERVWLREFEPSRLKQYHVQYLSPSDGYPSLDIEGLTFPGLAETIPMGEGRLHISACPESKAMHSPDQVIVRYTGPGHDILFSGDLWLMHGPLFSKNFRELTRRFRAASNRMKGALKGHRSVRRDPRLQDVEAKEALKRGFSLIRVMPGHGEDFIGTRIIPAGFLADRDLLVELGYAMDEKKDILQRSDLQEKIRDIRERAYAAFIKELQVWQQLGYDGNDTAALLARIYREQEGGGPLVREDRKERRQRIKETLARLSDDPDVPDFKSLAGSTLSKLEGIA